VDESAGQRSGSGSVSRGLHVNGDWRVGKHGIYQGGIRVPFLVRWPGTAPAGATCGETISFVDMLATVAAVVEQPLPAQGAAEDSHSALPTFLGKKLSKPVRESMISHSADGVFAIRQGGWKYIEGKPAQRLEKIPGTRKAGLVSPLYNLDEDPREEKNVIDARRDVAARMRLAEHVAGEGLHAVGCRISYRKRRSNDEQRRRFKTTFLFWKLAGRGGPGGRFWQHAVHEGHGLQVCAGQA
jgi:arylsulfatase A-like enzyme